MTPSCCLFCSRGLRERDPLLPGRFLVLLHTGSADRLLGELAVSLPIRVPLLVEMALVQPLLSPLLLWTPFFLDSGGLVTAENVALPCLCGRAEWQAGQECSCHLMLASSEEEGDSVPTWRGFQGGQPQILSGGFLARQAEEAETAAAPAPECCGHTLL